MKASLFKITTDKEGESKIIFLVPSSELTEVIKLNLLFEKLLELDVKEEDEAQTRSTVQERYDFK